MLIQLPKPILGLILQTSNNRFPEKWVFRMGAGLIKAGGTPYGGSNCVPYFLFKLKIKIKISNRSFKNLQSAAVSAFRSRAFF
jgi:hypothetical protein